MATTRCSSSSLRHTGWLNCSRSERAAPPPSAPSTHPGCEARTARSLHPYTVSPKPSRYQPLSSAPSDFAHQPHPLSGPAAASDSGTSASRHRNIRQQLRQRGLTTVEQCVDL
ncbi:hypothetical protein JOF35_005149 [Streptomyces demainii]|uniref:Uncharacterized protein n=1 Tax=Streptomyces demainii TaxID=588122 RepID=A0ABT9KWQ5_9ACTN|nr:hypothetical protein [Streptomyces demainii]